MKPLTHLVPGIEFLPSDQEPAPTANRRMNDEIIDFAIAQQEAKQLPPSKVTADQILEALKKRRKR